MQYWVTRAVAAMQFRQHRQFRSGSAILLQRDGRQFTKGDAAGHRKAPEFQELTFSGDFGNARCSSISRSFCSSGSDARRRPAATVMGFAKGSTLPTALALAR
jgi:hypothetical protein